MPRHLQRLARLTNDGGSVGARYVFLHGFAKKDKSNVTQDEKKALRFAGKVFLELSPAELTKTLQVGVLVKVHCVQQAH